MHLPTHNVSSGYRGLALPVLLAISMHVLAIMALQMKPSLGDLHAAEPKKPLNFVMLASLPSVRSQDVPKSDRTIDNAAKDLIEHGSFNLDSNKPIDEPKSPEVDSKKTEKFFLDSVDAHDTLMHDGKVELDFELASIKGVQLEMGSMKLIFAVQDGRYEVRSTSSMGSVDRKSSSQGAVGFSLRPEFYQGEGSDESYALMNDGDQDPLSIVWTLRSLVSQSLPNRINIPNPQWDSPLQTLASAKLTHWTLTQIDNLMLPSGNFRAAKVAATTDEDPISRINIWYALDYAYLPVRIEITDVDGTVRDSKIVTKLEK